MIEGWILSGIVTDGGEKGVPAKGVEELVLEGLVFWCFVHN